MKKFLGRIYDAKTMTWRFSDGSGVPLTEGFRKDFIYTVENRPYGGAEALGMLFREKDKFNTLRER